MKTLYICNTDGALINFRGPLIERLISDGHEVVTISSESKHTEDLRKLKAKSYFVPFIEARSIKENIKLIYSISKIIKQENPDIIHCFTHKANIFGALSAILSNKKQLFFTVTGLGKVFSNKGIKYKILQKIILFVYKLIQRQVNTIFFQNCDDLKLFKDNNIAKKKLVLTNGSGIDIKKYKLSTTDIISSIREKLNCKDNSTVIVMPARAMKEKGVNNFYEAAKIINKLSSDYVFVHIGGAYEEHGFSQSYLKDFASQCGVNYLGYVTNGKDILSASEIVVLPSYYREGTPKSLIEGLALGKYIITTDMPGCRETVIDNWNGRLLSPKSTEKLVSAILNYRVNEKELIASRSKKFCEYKYDVNKLYKLTVGKYYNAYGKNKV